LSESEYKSKEELIRDLEFAKAKVVELENALNAGMPVKKYLNDGAESALNHFNVDFPSTISAISVPYALNDDENNIVYVNPAFTKTFGYELSDIPTLDDWWPKAYPDENYRNWVNETWGKHLNKAIENNTAFEPLEIKIQCKDGSFRYIIASAESITESYKHVHLVTLFDITEQQLAKSELEKTVSLLDNVINSTPDLIVVKNNKLQTILCNHACSDAVGKTREDMYGKTDIENGWNPELVLGDEAKGTRGFIHDDMDALSGIDIYNPNDLANVNGEVRIFDTRKLALRGIKGEIIGLLAVARDVTEQKRATQALQEANDEFSAILKAIPDLLFELDEEGRYLNIWANNENLLATQKAALLGNLVKDMLPENVAAEIYKALSIAAKEGVSQGQIIRLELEDGDHWYELSTTLKTSKDKLKHFIMLSREITTRINTELQLRRTQKMDALGKLTGGIAHDYNNMLGVVLGYAEILGMELTEQPKLAKYVDQINHAGKRGVKLTQKLLAFSRLKLSDADCLNINSLLLNEQHMLEKTLTARIKLELDLTDNPWLVLLDDSDMEDAILNMSINAMHAIEGHGQLTIKTRNQSVNQMGSQLLGVVPGDYVLLSIEDTGSGMDAATKEKMFEPFFSTKGEKGTGLGLSQVYGFVQRSGGEIKVSSELNKGTKIEFYFPRYFESSSDEKSERNQSAVAYTGTESILIVDDESSLLNLAAEILGQYSFTIYSAESAKKALDVLENETIDLLISDIIMPEMDGYQLSAIVKEKYPHVKIQLVSGFADGSNVDVVDETLMQNMLHKPYSSQALIQRVRDLFNE